MNSYNEKFKLVLTDKELEVIEYALENYRDKVRPNMTKIIEKIIGKLYKEAWEV